MTDEPKKLHPKHDAWRLSASDWRRSTLDDGWCWTMPGGNYQRGGEAMTRWTNEGLHNVTDPTPDDRTMPPGSSVAYVIIFWAAAVFLTLGYVAVDRVWHNTVTPHNAERVE